MDRPLATSPSPDDDLDRQIEEVLLATEAFVASCAKLFLTLGSEPEALRRLREARASLDGSARSEPTDPVVVDLGPSPAHPLYDPFLDG